MRVFDSKKHKVLMIKMTKEEALQTVLSLTQQIVHNNCNYNRLETFLDDDGRDFSIAVSDEWK